MIQQDFPRTPSPVYQKPVSRPTKAEAAAAAAAAHIHAQATHSRELALGQFQQQQHQQQQHQQSRITRRQQAMVVAAQGQPNPMYYPEPVDQQLYSHMHSLSLNDTAQVQAPPPSDRREKSSVYPTLFSARTVPRHTTPRQKGRGRGLQLGQPTVTLILEGACP